MRGKKIIYLILALILPVFVFLFLKFFGRNEFDVQPLFQEPIKVEEACSGEYKFPYVIPDSLSTQLKINEYDLTIIPVLLNGDDSQEEISNQVKRIEEEFSTASFQIKWLEESEVDIDLRVMKTCVLLMPENTSIVLIDRAGRIRGQYDGASLDEMDRLIVEMKIILKRY